MTPSVGHLSTLLHDHDPAAEPMRNIAAAAGPCNIIYRYHTRIYAAFRNQFSKLSFVLNGEWALRLSKKFSTNSIHQSSSPSVLRMSDGFALTWPKLFVKMQSDSRAFL